MLTSIVLFCSLDKEWIANTFEAAEAVSDKVYGICSSHLFNGEKEDDSFLNSVYQNFPKVNFVEIQYQKDTVYGHLNSPTEKDLIYKRLQIASLRYVGYVYTKDADYLLFLDGDEILDRDKFRAWLDTKPFSQCDTHYLLAYAYFRSLKYRATFPQRCSLCIRREKLSKELLLHPDERSAIYEYVEGNKTIDVLAPCQSPMIHHVGWVRSQEAMLKKTTCWGHHFEKNWEQLIREEFTTSFSGKDFWSKSPYEKLDANPITFRSLNTLTKKPTNVTKVTPELFFKEEIFMEFGL